MADIEKVLQAARATHIPEGRCGRWAVRRYVTDRWERWTSNDKNAKPVRVGPGTYTLLTCATEATAMTQFEAEVVMNDSEPELRSHLQAMLTAEGRVLVTGLGLGCVVRGMLEARSDYITEIVVLEREPAVLELVGRNAFPSDWLNRVKIIYADAEQWLKTHRLEKFDCAWHDVWTDTGAGEVHLAARHCKIMAECLGRVKRQGAWSFPRYLSRLVNRATNRRA